jgi:hypothetical protein
MAEGHTIIRFWGSSDDLIEIDNVEGTTKGADEYNTEAAAFEVAGLRVGLAYGDNGCWGIEVTRLDEDVPVTAENLKMAPHENGYSMALEMMLPPGSYITKVADPNA